MGIRSPYLENGISMFSANYRNADAHAKLLLQICTNLTYYGSVSETITTYPPSYHSYWDTVATFDFSTMTATERQSGTITHYMSYRAPVHGLVRLVVDESVIQYCLDNETSSSRNVNYGQIFIESAGDADGHILGQGEHGQGNQNQGQHKNPYLFHGKSLLFYVSFYE